MQAQTVELLSAPKAKAKTAVYWPELDVLRLFAFVCVFLTHGPRIAGETGWRHILQRVFNTVANSGVYGLCLFFFLSSYLITELLLRERRKTGSVHLRLFYMRRILRIWPLYYLALGLAVITPYIFQEGRFTHWDLLEFAVFLGFLTGTAHGNPFGVLWSISVEELFYAVWPLFAKGGQHRLLIGSAFIVPMALLLAFLLPDIWYSPPVQFLFFATGALVAIGLQGRAWSVSLIARLSLAVAALCCWATVPTLFRVWANPLVKPVGFLIADIGCVLLFLGFLRFSLPTGWLTKSLLYLGRISYGLYVFHLFCYGIVRQWLAGAGQGFRAALTVHVLTLTLTILLAACSYHFFEKPFLRLKDRYLPR